MPFTGLCEHSSGQCQSSTGSNIPICWHVRGAACDLFYTPGDCTELEFATHVYTNHVPNCMKNGVTIAMSKKLWLAMVLFSVVGVAACSSDSGTNIVADNDVTDNDNADNTADASNPDTTDNTDATDESDDNSEGAPDDTASQAIEATYRVTFNATWSQATHPTNFPADPHFSGLVGAVHSEQAILWEPGQIASAGIEQMAETGGKTILLSEIASIVGEGRALSEISGGGVGTSPGSVSVEFTVTRDNPQVSLVSMVAPSPDWFVGVHGLNMLDNNGQFLQSTTVDLAVYDAGTDSGLQYASANEDTLPRETIALVNSDSADSDLVNGQPVAGQFVFERLQ